MRLPGRCAALLLLSGGIFVPGCVTVHMEVTPEAQARAALTHARGVFAGFVQSHSAVPCGQRSCYPAGDITALVSNVEERLHRELPQEAAPLRAAVDDIIAAEIAQLQPRAAASVYLVKLQAPPSPSFDAPSVDSALGRIVSAIDHILSYDKLALTLSITSVPARANFEMLIKENRDTVQSTRTNGTLPNVWRGIYTAAVSRSGYKTASARIDLIGDGRTSIRCELQPNDSKEESICQRN